MKTIKLVALVALFAVTGCKEATNVMVAHAKPVDETVQYQYSGANIPATAARGQVYEYH